MKTFRFIFAAAISTLLSLTCGAREYNGPLIADEAPLFGGVAVSADLVGFSMKAIGGKFANMEVSGRLNFMEKYFPLVELGIGECDKEGGDNSNKFHTRAPYFRIGADYNFNRKFNGNRFFGGLRYGFTSYEYDFDNPTFQDAVWKTQDPLHLHGLNGRNQWFELAIGVETKLWSIVRLGWSLRYRMKLRQKVSEMGEPWYVPGFGKNGTTTFGGTVNLTFDVGKSAKSNKKKKK